MKIIIQKSQPINIDLIESHQSAPQVEPQLFRNYKCQMIMCDEGNSTCRNSFPGLSVPKFQGSIVVKGMTINGELVVCDFRPDQA